MERVHILVSGKVQGVNFRAYTVEKGRELGVKGWVRNLDDGRVEILVEGEENKIENLIRFCHSGSPSARVKEVYMERESYQGDLENFQIEY